MKLILFSIVAIIAIVLTIYLLNGGKVTTSSEIKRNGIAGTAVLTSKYKKKHLKKNYFNYFLKATRTDQSIQTEIEVNSDTYFSLKVGDEVSILYLENHPSKSILK